MSFSTLVFFVNGHKVVEQQVDPEWNLAYYIRTKLRLCGTKLACGEGGCGSCTVMLSHIDRSTKQIRNLAINSCLTPLCSVHGMAITTIEGIGNIAKGIHPVQERIAKCHGSQCGFCTPGVCMSMYTLLRNNAQPTVKDVENSLGGNLCRCTGYRPILEGFSTLARDSGCCGPNGDTCCKSSSTSTCAKEDNPPLYESTLFKPYDPTQDPIFPPELQVSSEYDEDNLVFRGERVTWHRATSLEYLLTLKSSFPFAKIIVGNTKLGIDKRHKENPSSVLISAGRINELTEIKNESRGIRCGAAVTLTELGVYLQEQIKSIPFCQTKFFKSLCEMLESFGGTQIRNVASLGGSIATGSPTSDLNPILMAANAEVVLRSNADERVFTLDESFFTGACKTILNHNEVIVSILIPFSTEGQHFASFKQAKRRILDGATVNACMLVEMDIGTNVVKQLSLAFGGVGNTIIMAKTTTSTLVGRPWNEDIVTEASKCLLEDLPFNLVTPGIALEYRRSLALSFFFKFYLQVASKLHENLRYIKAPPAKFKSAEKSYRRQPAKGHQLSQIVPEGQNTLDPIGRPTTHVSAIQQATGEAVYIDDMPRFENEYYLALVLSTRAHAEIVSIDASEALEADGVIDFISAKDLPGNRNKVGPVIQDEEVFASEKVTCHGQVIGAIVGMDKLTAQRAVQFVKIEYKDISPAIITIEDAIRHKSFYHDWTRTLTNGDVAKGFAEADRVIEGEISIGGQEHFYMETQVAIAVPKNENGEMEVISATQNLTNTQFQLATVLDVPPNKIVVRTKRLGGGFGGKSTRSTILALPLAVAAQKLGHPVRGVLEREEDMRLTGTRHPVKAKYKVGFKKDGTVTTLKVTYYSNAGNSLDNSYALMERIMYGGTNAYSVANVEFVGYSCKTNVASNTALRGFGNPQTMLICEAILDHVAGVLEMDSLQLREKNMVKEGSLTHYNQTLEHCTLRRCWDECLTNSNFRDRKEQVDSFNKENRWRKRGISIVPTVYGICFPALFMNQAGALVIVYRDGSVLLTHGGVEMGQALHTKMIQIASRIFQIPTDRIHISETATDKIPNTSPSAASVTTDLNGMAVLNACTTITERLEPYKTKNPTGKWEDWVKAAYFDRVSLSSTGFYKYPEIGYDLKTNAGTLFLYHCYGAAVSEVEIDCLTGDHSVLRTDIVMDVGESLNPAIDIGQIEGAFIQGYGLYTMEELCHSPAGALLTTGPSSYKIPTICDVPLEFNVCLLRGAPNIKAVYSSKAIGEQAVFLAASVFFAIKNAIKDARKEVGLINHLHIDSPLTAQRIRMACEDQFTKSHK